MNTMHIRGRAGVTLIEVVAALGILAVGIVGLLTLFPLGLDASKRASDHTTAAILGEYVIEQVRLQHADIEPTDDTYAALRALNWDDYTDPEGRKLTFECDEDGNLPSGSSADGFGSGEQIAEQDPGALTDQELYSRYEVSIHFGEVVKGRRADGSLIYNTAFTDSAGVHMMQVTVTIRWPRAFTPEERKHQETMTFVTYVRPES